MSDQGKKIPIPKELTHVGVETMTEMLPQRLKGGKFTIGIPLELTKGEKRVALIPSSIKTLVTHGHQILVQSNAGIGAHFTDQEFSEAGAKICNSLEEVYDCDLIIKVAPPSIQEIELMKPYQLLISPLQLPLINCDYIQKLQSKKVIALAMEYIQDEVGTFPIVRIMSEMAGLNAILTGAELLSKANGGKGMLLGGISGVPSAKVVILGAGIVSEYATRAALGLGAEVRIFDDNIYKLKKLQNKIGRPVYTSAVNQTYLKEELISADLAIGAMHSKTGRTPMIVDENMVMSMKKGSVIIDVSIDQGGCFETSEVTSFEKPTFIKHDVIHYCVPNMASKVSRTASIAFSNILTPILLKASHPAGIEYFITSQPGLRNGIYSFKGYLTNAYLSHRFNLKFMDLSLLITSQH